MIHHYTVIGNPIDHSISPKIHSLFAEQTQRKIDYTRTLSTKDSFETDVRRFMESGGRGMNITLPFKQSVLNLCTNLSPAATLANAVNTVKFLDDGSVYGHNTDGSGLLADLTENHEIPLTNTRILIAGAGGSARGILGPLLEKNPSEIVIANRSLENARRLADNFNGEVAVVGCSYQDIPKQPFQLIINATSLSLSAQRPDIPAECVDSKTVAYDLMYNRVTPFMSWIKEKGALKALDGTGMLLEQAADAFLLWEDVRPKTRLILPRLILPGLIPPRLQA